MLSHSEHLYIHITLAFWENVRSLASPMACRMRPMCMTRTAPKLFEIHPTENAWSTDSGTTTTSDLDSIVPRYTSAGASLFRASGLERPSCVVLYRCHNAKKVIGLPQEGNVVSPPCFDLNSTECPCKRQLESKEHLEELSNIVVAVLPELWGCRLLGEDKSVRLWAMGSRP